MHGDGLKNIALQPTADLVLQTAVEFAKQTLATDTSFAALPTSNAAYAITMSEGLRDPRVGTLAIRRHAGLGGAVLASQSAMLVRDYPNDTRISRDFVEIITGGEGLHAVVCAPIRSAGQIEALLYVGSHGRAALSDRAVGAIEPIASYAEVGIERLRQEQLEVEISRLRERERLATQLHDSVAQRLFAIGAVARATSSRRGVDSLIAALDEIAAVTREAQSELRGAVVRLTDHPEHVAFEARLLGDLRLLERTAHCRATLVRTGTVRPLPQDVEDLVLDTALEGARNAIKHRHARAVSVSLDYAPERLWLEVRENGLRSDGASAASSVEPDGEEPSTSGAGLQVLRVRAARLRGALTLDLGAGGRSSLRLELPLRPLQAP